MMTGSPITPEALKQCTDAWAAALSFEAVLLGDAITPYEKNCLGLKRTILAVLRPTTEEQVVRIVEIAQQHNVSLYPFSGGNNWGYGSKQPVVDHCALVDLSGMNRIIAMDNDLGLVTLEPGVTQGQLFEYLQKHGLDYYVPTTGAGPTGSIIGNALERGFGITPMEDHFQAATSLRAVMADGGIYQSPFSEMGGDAAGVWKWGIGPYMDGLFTQSNLGIVTAMQFALVARAKHVEIYAIYPKKGTTLTEHVTACKTLLQEMRGSMQGIKFLNRFQMEAVSGKQAHEIPVEYATQWVGVGVLQCSPSLLSPLRSAIRQHFSKYGRILFMNRARHRMLAKIAAFIPAPLRKPIAQKLYDATYVMDIADGIPRGNALRLVYAYETPSVIPPVNPIADNVGLIWYAPVLPMKPALIAEMMEGIRTILSKYQFPPILSFTTVNDKCAIGVLPVIYRKEQDQQKAHECYKALVAYGNSMGCPPYRTNVEAMKKLTGDPTSVYWSTVSKIKQALDPQDILSPGRYCPVLKD